MFMFDHNYTRMEANENRFSSQEEANAKQQIFPNNLFLSDNLVIILGILSFVVSFACAVITFLSEALISFNHNAQFVGRIIYCIYFVFFIFSVILGSVAIINFIKEKRKKQLSIIGFVFALVSFAVCSLSLALNIYLLL